MACQWSPRLTITCRSRLWLMEVKKRSAKVRVSISRLGFHALQYHVDNHIGEAGERIIALLVEQDPGGHHLVHSAEETVYSDLHRQFGTEDSGLLSFAQHAFDQIKIFHQKVVRELGQKFGAVTQFRLKDDRHVAV